jgi:hypothetical protein
LDVADRRYERLGADDAQVMLTLCPHLADSFWCAVPPQPMPARPPAHETEQFDGACKRVVASADP